VQLKKKVKINFLPKFIIEFTFDLSLILTQLLQNLLLNAITSLQQLFKDFSQTLFYFGSLSKTKFLGYIMSLGAKVKNKIE